MSTTAAFARVVSPLRPALLGARGGKVVNNSSRNLRAVPARARRVRGGVSQVPRAIVFVAASSSGGSSEGNKNKSTSSGRTPPPPPPRDFQSELQSLVEDFLPPREPRDHLFDAPKEHEGFPERDVAVVEHVEFHSKLSGLVEQYFPRREPHHETQPGARAGRGGEPAAGGDMPLGGEFQSAVGGLLNDFFPKREPHHDGGGVGHSAAGGGGYAVNTSAEGGEHAEFQSALGGLIEDFFPRREPHHHEEETTSPRE